MGLFRVELGRRAGRITGGRPIRAFRRVTRRSRSERIGIEPNQSFDAPIIPTLDCGEPSQPRAFQGLPSCRHIRISRGRTFSVWPGSAGKRPTRSSTPIARVFCIATSSPNLLVDSQGIVWVTDFGLAKTVDSDGLTETGEVFGTVRYMAPERFEGRGDSRSDVYCLGLTLYELVGAATRVLWNRTLQSDAADPEGGAVSRCENCNARVPPDLETIIHKAVCREPAQRVMPRPARWRRTWAGFWKAALSRHAGRR